MSHTDILCLTLSTWDGPKRVRHNLMREYAKRGHRVIFVEVWLTWIKLLRGPVYWKAAANVFRRPRLTEEGIYVAAMPPLLPGGEWIKFINDLNWSIVQWWLQRFVLKKIPLQNPRLFLFAHTAARLVGKFNESISIYFCNDPFKQIFEFKSAHANLGRMEDELTERVDLVFAVSEKLVEERKRHNPNTFLIPHAADIELFQKAMEGSLAIPADLAACPKPVFGHIGVLNNRIDVELLRELSRLMPEASFVLIGPVIEVMPQFRQQLDSLKLCGNIYFLGNKEESALPSYLAGIDVCIVPYLWNDFTKYIKANAKFYQAVAAGRPVVSTIGPADFDEEIVITAKTPTQFVDALHRALGMKSAKYLQKRRAVSALHTYSARVDEIERVIGNLKR